MISMPVSNKDGLFSRNHPVLIATVERLICLSLSNRIEFFRVASTATPALLVHVSVGDASGARLAAACVAESPGSAIEGGEGCAFE